MPFMSHVWHGTILPRPLPLFLFFFFIVRIGINTGVLMGLELSCRSPVLDCKLRQLWKSHFMGKHAASARRRVESTCFYTLLFC